MSPLGCCYGETLMDDAIKLSAEDANAEAGRGAGLVRRCGKLDQMVAHPMTTSDPTLDILTELHAGCVDMADLCAGVADSRDARALGMVERLNRAGELLGAMQREEQASSGELEGDFEGCSIDPHTPKPAFG